MAFYYKPKFRHCLAVCPNTFSIIPSRHRNNIYQCNEAIDICPNRSGPTLQAPDAPNTFSIFPNKWAGQHVAYYSSKKTLIAPIQTLLLPSEHVLIHLIPVNILTDRHLSSNLLTFTISFHTMKQSTPATLCVMYICSRTRAAVDEAKRDIWKLGPDSYYAFWKARINLDLVSSSCQLCS